MGNRHPLAQAGGAEPFALQLPQDLPVLQLPVVIETLNRELAA